MQVFVIFLSHKSINSSRKRTYKSLYLEKNEIGRHICIGFLYFHNNQVDMQSFFRFLQFAKDGSLPFR